MTRSFVIMTKENAPRTCEMASTIAASVLSARERANRWTTTSVSLLVWKMAPSRTSSSRSSPAFTRLPLWPIANWPCTLSTTIGCAFESLLSPAVE